MGLIEELDIDDGAGVPAAEGTILHSFMEDCLRQNVDAYTFVDETREHDDHSLTLTEELADTLQEGLDEIDTIPGKIYVETRVDLSRWMPGQFGTLDVGIAGKDEIVVWDHKFGYLPVSPVKNAQLSIYGLGFWDNIARHVTRATQFLFVIFQPFAPGGGGYWRVTLEELLEFGKTVKAAAKLTYDPNAPRVPGLTQCAYCPAARNLDCNEYMKFNMSALISDFDEMDELVESDLPPRLKGSTSMTPERRSWLIANRGMFTKWLDRLEAECLDDFLKGRPTPGRKAVLGRKPPRKYRDPERAEAYLTNLIGDEAYSKKLLSPTNIESVLPAKMFAKFSEVHVVRGDPKTILVDEADSRPAVKTLADEFDDFD